MLSKVNHAGLFLLGTAFPIVSGGLYLADQVNGGTAGLGSLFGVWSMWAGHDLKKSTRRRKRKQTESDTEEE